jgi:hypothetical protein
MVREDRKAKRSRSGTKAWIRPDEGFSVRPCVIADLSSTGVQLVVDSPSIVSPTFMLLMTRDARQGHRCRVKWRKGTRLGAEFVRR